jgi:DNA-binding MarR family transcriptional regulator
MNDKYIVYFISKIKKKMVFFIEKKLNENGLGELKVSHGNILTSLYENGGSLKMNQMAEIIGKDKSTVTSLVNKLESLGYVRKTTDDKDKRATIVVLTDKGKDAENKFNSISKMVRETAYNDFSPQQKEQLLLLLKKLNSNFS